MASLTNHPRGVNRPGERVSACMVASGLSKPVRVKKGKKSARPPYELDWVNFHTFCHTYATWIRRYGGLDT
jgi:hypothetical protein